MNLIAFQVILSIGITLFGLAATIYGLHLSRQNNIKYNQKMVLLLEKIEQNTSMEVKNEPEEEGNN